MAPKSDLLQGTLDLLILRTLSGEPMHGWGISQRIQQLSKDVLQVNQGSLYPALHRLEQQGLIEAEWGSVGKQPAGEVLSAHPRGTETAHRRDEELGAPFERRRARTCRLITDRRTVR